MRWRILALLLVLGSFGFLVAYQARAEGVTLSVTVCDQFGVCPDDNDGSSGGGGVNSNRPALVSFSGLANTGGRVVLLKNGQRAKSEQAALDGRFYVLLDNLSPGTYTFSLYAQDVAGRRSSLFTMPLNLASGQETQVANIFLSPTVALATPVQAVGDNVVLVGQTVPRANVSTLVSPTPNSATHRVQADNEGNYQLIVPTTGWLPERYVFRVRAVSSRLTSEESLPLPVPLGVGKPTPPSGCPARGDLNSDCRVDLVDFSILAYWLSKLNPPTHFDLNSDKVIDLVDFSIIAFYWTG